VTLEAGELADGVGIVQLFRAGGPCGVGKDAKRLIAEGGAKVNDEIVTDVAALWGEPSGRAVEADGAGKKRHALVVLG
jgi:tyrosyl-tRNA synthetase